MDTSHGPAGWPTRNYLARSRPGSDHPGGARPRETNRAPELSDEGPANEPRPRAAGVRSAGASGGPVLGDLVVVLVVGAGVVGELVLEEARLAPALAQVAVVSVQQPELADVGHELGEERLLEPGELVGAQLLRGLQDRRQRSLEV